MKTLVLHIVLLIGFWPAAHAQKAKIDSLFEAGTREVYENPDKAIAIGTEIYQYKGISIAKKTSALIMISDAYSSKRNYQKSLEYMIRAKELSAQTENVLVKIRVLTKTAIQYQQLRIYDKAIDNLDQAAELSLDYPKRDSVHYFLGHNAIIRGFIYKEQFNCSIAIDYFDKGMAEYASVKDKMMNANRSIVTYNKGNCYIQLSDYPKARESFAQSVAYAKSIDAKSLHAFALKGLAEVLTLEGQYHQAIQTLTEAERISNEVGDLVLNQGIYKGLSENYLAVNQWNDYQKFQQRYLETQQKITQSERQSVSSSLSQQEKNLSRQVSQIQSNYILAILLVVVAIFLAVMAFVFYGKKSQKKIAALQKSIKELQQKSV